MVTQSLTKTATESRRPGRVPSDEVRQHYRSLLCRLPWSGSGAADPIVTLGITSCYSGEGVSTVACQLAATAASTAEQRVLLVDSNLTRPAAERTFELEPGAGVAEVLLEGRNPLACIKPSPVRNLSVLAAGRLNGQAGRAEHAAGFAEMIEAVQDDFNLVVFDMPAAGQVGFAVRLASLLDGVPLVVEAERVRWEVARRAIEELGRANVNLLGAVLNKRRQHVPDWLYRTL